MLAKDIQFQLVGPPVSVLSAATAEVLFCTAIMERAFGNVDWVHIVKVFAGCSGGIFVKAAG